MAVKLSADAIIDACRTSWGRTVDQHRQRCTAQTRAFLEECTQQTEEEIAEREQACIAQLEADMEQLAIDRAKPNARDFILNARESSLLSLFESSMKFFTTLRETTLESYMEHQAS